MKRSISDLKDNNKKKGTCCVNVDDEVAQCKKHIKVCEDFIEKVTSNLEESEKIKNIFKRRNNCEVGKLEHLTKEAKDCFESTSKEYKEILEDRKIKNCSLCGRGGVNTFRLQCGDFTRSRCVKK